MVAILEWRLNIFDIISFTFIMISMINTPVSLANVKIYYDQHGQAREVVMSYETYRKIETLLQELTGNDDQSYFWSESWQARIREGEADIHAGRTKQATVESIDSLLEWLDE